MTQQEPVEKIKAEIDRLLAIPDLGFEDGDVEHGYTVALLDIKRFINSLKQEPSHHED